MTKKKHIKLVLKFAVSLFFLWWIIFQVNWVEVWEYLQKISVWNLLAFVLVYILGVALSTYKWRRLAMHKDINFSFWVFFKSYYTAIFINNFMPSFIGGDSFKIYKIGKDNNKYKEAASSVIMDRLTGLFGAIILALFFSLVNLGNIWDNKFLFSINVIMLSGLILWFLVIKFFGSREIKTSFSRINKIINTSINEINSYNGKSNELKKATLFSLLFNFVGVAGVNYILFWSMGIDIRVLDYLSIIFLISIVSSIPISINNIGIKEWAYITFFGFFGLNPTAVISVAIVSRIIQMIISFFALPIYLNDRKVKVRNQF